MICFRDMTFFSSSDECAVKNFRYNFNDDQKRKQGFWLGPNVNPQVSFGDYIVGCPDYEEIERGYQK